MRYAVRCAAIAAALVSCALAAQAPASPRLAVPMKPGLLSVKIRVGLKDKQPTAWQGTYRVTEGRIIATDGWRFIRDDYATPARFKLQVRRWFPLFFRLQKRDVTKLPTAPNGFFLTVEGATASSRLEVETSQGNFTVPLGKLPYGAVRMFLDGNVEVERVPSWRTIVAAPTEDSHPSAAAGPDGSVCVAYVAYTHGEGHRVRAPIKEEPKDFSFLAVPAGGDRVMFTEVKGGQWTKPVPLTPPGGDLFRTAVAVDGKGRPWVFWAANVEGNVDLYARVRSGEQWSPPKRITSAPGSDIHHAAATDSEGRIWIAWQSFRGDNSDIFAARQDGDGFGQPEKIAGGPANEWVPAIAASADGHVAVAWDTYGLGDYDVRLRIWRGGAWGKPRVVAATARNECRPSLAYDGQGRLWIAYESSPEGWGKDFGPYDQSPKRMPLYRQREVGLKVLVGQSFFAPQADVNRAMPMPNGMRRWPKSSRKAVLAAAPKLAVDATGRVWLAARCRMAKFVCFVGTTYMNFVTTLDATGWRSAAIVGGTDGYLHQAPALVGAPGGGLLLIAAADGRLRSAALHGTAPWKNRQRSKGIPPATTRTHGKYPDWWVNWEIAAADTGRLAPPGDVKLKPVADDPPRESSPEAQREARHVAAIRAYRTQVGGQTVRILRGEFHRHTEISSDGGGDGTIYDMWRYAIDMAALDWIGFGDHDNGGREYGWWLSQKTTDLFHLPGTFTPMFTYERSCNYPDGHRNALFAKRGIRPLNRLRGGMGKALDDLPPDKPRPHTPDTQMFYKYLRFFDGICASHTSGTNMGTDWRDGDPKVEPIVEIYQGCRQSYERAGAPRTNTADYSLGAWRPLGFVSRALLKGYRLGFQSSSDHISTHISYCNVFVPTPTRQNILEAMKRRHIYGATDNIIADVRCGTHFMGDEFTVTEPPTIKVKLIGTAPFARVVIVKDNQYVYTATPNKRIVDFEWTDRQAKPGTTSYYYVRGEQVGQDRKIKRRSQATKQPIELTLNNGEIVWCSPMWITYKP